MGSEDVFDDDAENQTSLTFVSSSCANQEQLDNVCDQNRNCLKEGFTDNEKRTHSDKETVNVSLNAIEIASRFQESLKTLPEVVTQRVSTETNDLDTGQRTNDLVPNTVSEKEKFTDIKDDSINNNTNVKPIPPKTLDIRTNNNVLDSGTVSKISVNRSYAKGDSTFSVAVRSTSPYPPSDRNKLSAYSEQKMAIAVPQNNNALTAGSQDTDEIYDKDSSPRNTPTYRENTLWDNRMLELIFLVTGTTFLAVCFDLPPLTYILDVLMALIIWLVLRILIEEMQLV